MNILRKAAAKSGRNNIGNELIKGMIWVDLLMEYGVLNGSAT